MPEYPEIRHLSDQMNTALAGKTLSSADVTNEKCLNLTAEAFNHAISGRSITASTSKGKWAFLLLENGDRLALNLNMGGNVVLFAPGEGPREKWRVCLRFTDGWSLSIGFWFLGHLHYLRLNEPHPLTDGLGADPMAEDFSFEDFDRLLGARKTPIKTVLLKQDIIAGIGNYYIQDLLFLEHIHPIRPTSSITEEERRSLYGTLRTTLAKATAMGGAWYENGLYDDPGQFRELLIGYKENQPCPVCGTSIIKIKTGSTSGYVCTVCQPECGND